MGDKERAVVASGSTMILGGGVCLTTSVAITMVTLPWRKRRMTDSRCPCHSRRTVGIRMALTDHH